jgi:phenylacetate-CoA ligase
MDYQNIHQNLSAHVRRIMPHHLARLTWSREKIHHFQLSQLKALLEHVKAHAPFYQKSLNKLDIASMTLDDLNTLPILHKQDVLDNWDDMVCVPGLTKSIAEKHLQTLRDDKSSNPFYNNQYYITATGGSSGVRGLYAWNLDYFTHNICAAFRYQVFDEQACNQPRTIAALTAPTAIHASTPISTIKLDTRDTITHLPVNLPISELCNTLNTLQPTHILGYASMVVRLAAEQLLGILHINPKRAITIAEPLDDMGRDMIFKAWSIQPNNTWGSVEMGIAGIEDDRHQGLILSEDMLIFEPVDAKLKPVKHPKEAEKIIITNVFNKTLPLIRYVVDDVTEITHKPFTGYQVTEPIAGRTDEWFSYPNHIELHPIQFRALLGQDPAIREYQVEQIAQGAIIRLIANDALNQNRLQKKLEHIFKKAGLDHAKVRLERVSSLVRHEETGKLKRFIPLPV